MAARTRLREWLNRALSGVNLRLETLTAKRRELALLQRYAEAGGFTAPVFPVPDSFNRSDVRPIVDAVKSYADRIDALRDPATNQVGYSLENQYYASPDAEVLYAMVRTHRPRRIVEVGSGNSTKIMRQAIRDGSLSTEIIAIDPQPRTGIEGMATHMRQRVEQLTEQRLAEMLMSGDFLFIDSSHFLSTASDVAFLFLRAIPRIPSGTILHVHDVFLPFEYPKEWVVEQGWGWTEQYLVQAMLYFGSGFDVLWPGHYLQRTRSEFATWFPHLGNRAAASLWLRKR